MVGNYKVVFSSLLGIVFHWFLGFRVTLLCKHARTSHIIHSFSSQTLLAHSTLCSLIHFPHRTHNQKNVFSALRKKFLPFFFRKREQSSHEKGELFIEWELLFILFRRDSRQRIYFINFKQRNYFSEWAQQCPNEHMKKCWANIWPFLHITKTQFCLNFKHLTRQSTEISINPLRNLDSQRQKSSLWVI